MRYWSEEEARRDYEYWKEREEERDRRGEHSAAMHCQFYRIEAERALKLDFGVEEVA